MASIVVSMGGGGNQLELSFNHAAAPRRSRTGALSRRSDVTINRIKGWGGACDIRGYYTRSLGHGCRRAFINVEN